MAGFALPHMLYDGRFMRPDQRAAAAATGLPLPHTLYGHRSTAPPVADAPLRLFPFLVPAPLAQRQQRGIRRRRAPAVPFSWPYAPHVDAEAAASDSDEDEEEEGFGAVAASERAIDELRKTTAGEAREKGCSVCMEAFDAGDRLRTMPCGHSFHQSCLFEWLELSRLCPLCRFALPTHEEEDDQLTHALASYE